MRNMRRIIGIWLGVMLAVTAGNAADDSVEGYFFPDKAGAWEYKLFSNAVLQFHGKDLGCKVGPDKPFCDKVQLIFDVARANPVFNPPLGFQARAMTAWASTGLPAGARLSADFQVIFYYFVNVERLPGEEKPILRSPCISIRKIY
jgi:hypothetical protein